MPKMILYLPMHASIINFQVWAHFVIAQGNTTKLNFREELILNLSKILLNLCRSCTIWCGHSHGKVTVFEFKTDTFESRQFNLQHANSASPEISVTILATSQNSIYAYPSPGCVLYQWNALSKKLMNQLDCLKLVPCSESLGSISIDKSLSVGRCQVSSVRKNWIILFNFR